MCTGTSSSTLEVHLEHVHILISVYGEERDSAASFFPVQPSSHKHQSFLWLLKLLFPALCISEGGIY